MSNPNIHSMLEEHPFCVVKTSMFGAYDVTTSPTFLKAQKQFKIQVRLKLGQVRLKSGQIRL